MFRIIAKSLRTGILTEREPFTARPPFGFPVIDFAKCTACDECARACPTGAIQVSAPAPDRRKLSLSYAACIQCRECVTACPEQAVSPGRDFEVAAYTRDQLTHTALFDVDGAGRATFRQVEAQPGPGLGESAARLRERIRGRLGRSLHVRQVDAGSCNGCELEIAATTNPVFDLERFGIHFVASPRHADLLLVTGPVTRNMEIALRKTYEATPGAAGGRRRGSVRVQRRDLRRGHLRGRGRSRPRRARGRLHPGVSAPAPSDPQRPAGGHGRARGAPETGRVTSHQLEGL